MDPIEARLRRERATASSLELDELKMRAMRQAAKTTGIRGNLMKSRLALLLMIVAGFMLSTTGATLAITGSSGDGSAADHGYPHYELDDNGTSGGQTLAGQEEGNGDTPADTGGGGGEEPAAAQEAAQEEVSGGDDTLPFTGFLAIPLLIGGVALMGTGAVLRWKARD